MGTITIKEKLTSLIQKEIRFEVSQDKLLVKGNLGILSTEDKHFLKDNKQAIMSLIKLQNEENVSIQKADEYAPKLLSFSQQSLWL